MVLYAVLLLNSSVMAVCTVCVELLDVVVDDKPELYSQIMTFCVLLI